MVRVLLLALGLLGWWLSPASADALADVRAGNQAFAEGRIEQAVAAFTRAIEAGGLEPESLALALNNRGVALGELGDFDKAIADYDRALSLKPGDPKTLRNLRIAYTRRATAAARLGEPERAIADLGRAIELDPDHPTAWLRRGELRLERGEIEAAIADLETAARLAPDQSEPRLELDRARAALAARNARPSGQAAVAPPPAPAADGRASTGAPVVAGQAATAAANPLGASPAAPVAAAPASAPAPVARARAVGETAESAPSERSTGARFRVTSDVFVRAEPATGSAAVGSLRRGTEFTARAEEKGWFKVELDGGRTGWVYKRFLEALGSPGG
ncbi:MAG: tetratricopeptide repeat protein [Geminicoccaceae bacterium]|nr:tetratricopeptide repeat protein [Geminicoccaceae bacterium]